ncbi:hypothetical protein L3Y34_000505 [Caenorhabditis briggsae]|uniref:Uncharacterized protein n=1 Tax=Caenorhabditis briggsae TaxID=6238 RepID=A0AAE9D9E4_CAEBR|nr:hypothetical protein L3Y34_000505 [Caenorhabditis briggsae]
MRPEKDSEVWTKSDEQRKRAGFEFAAEPMEVLLLFPTIYYMAGMSVLIVILSIVLWITFPLMWDYFVWSVSSTLSIGLIIFLPEYFSNIISFAIHLCYWVVFDYERDTKKSRHSSFSESFGIFKSSLQNGAKDVKQKLNCRKFYVNFFG